MLLPHFRILMAPEGSSNGGGGSAPAAQSSAPSPSASPSPQSGGSSGATTPANPATGAGSPGAESPQDRARARKGLNNEFLTSKDNAIHKTRAKVGSLEDIKKLGQKARTTGELSDRGVELDPGAADGSDPLAERRGDKTPNPEVDDGSTRNESKKDKGSAVSDPLDGELVGEETAEGEYTPNLKYKAYDEEHEVPELFQNLIKDPESERQVHEVFQKLHGFEKVKANFTQLDSTVREQLVPEINFYRGFRQDLNDSLQRDDFFGAMQKLNIPEQKVLQAVADRVRIMEMPSEQRAQYEARVAAEQRQRESERQLAQLATEVQESKKLAKRSAFESVLAREDIASAAEDFDGRLAKPGAFRQAVIDYGDLVYRSSEGRVDLSPEQAVEEIIRRYGLNATARSAPRQSPPQSRTAPKAQGTRQPTQQRIIPNVASNAASSARTRPQINSVDDIRKERKLRYGR